MSKIPVKHYTISSQLFTSLADAKKKLAEFYEENPTRFNRKTKLFVVTEIFDVDVQERVEVSLKKVEADACCGECDDRPEHPNCKNIIAVAPKKKGKKKNG